MLDLSTVLAKLRDELIKAQDAGGKKAFAHFVVDVQ